MKRRTFILGAGALGTAVAATGAGVLASRPGSRLVPGKSRARSIVGDEVLPQSTEVVIIGGGFAGANAALTLAERGIPVVLCEKGVVAGEASGRSMGFMNGQFADPLKTPMILRSKELWAGMNARLGADSSFRPRGATLALADGQVDFAQAWIDRNAAFDKFDYRIVTGSELESLLPGNRNLPKAALFSPSDGAVDSSLAVPAIAEVARSRGVTLLQNCAVREVELSGGQVSGVVTEKGTIACKTVIVAGGHWTPLFMSGMGIRMPQVDVYLSQCALSAVDGPTMPYQSERYGVRIRADGTFAFGVVTVVMPIEPTVIRNLPLLGPAREAAGAMATLGLSFKDFWNDLTEDTHSIPSPYENRRILMPEVNVAPMTEGIAALAEDYPAFKDAKVIEEWAGAISSTPDNMPYITGIPSHQGLFVGSGLEAGLSWGPAVGEALADLAMGNTPQFDLANYRSDRFTDGSPIAFH